MKVKFIQILTGKKICFLVLIIFLTLAASNFALAQSEKEIVKIRAEVTEINKGAAKYTKTTKDVEDIALEGAEATFYRSAGNLRKITAKMYGETYNATGEFYYRDGQLIFAFLKHNRYDTQIGLDKPPKVASTEEQRFYFAGGDLIRLLIGKTELKSGDERYSDLKDEIISVSGKLKDS